MKKLILITLVTLALSVRANNYLDEFNTHLQNGDLPQAALFLNLWEVAKPDDPELFGARANIMLQGALSGFEYVAPEVNEDKTTIFWGGQSQTDDNENGMNITQAMAAVRELDRGINAFPKRLDFRVGKIYAATVMNRFDIAAKEMKNIVSTPYDVVWTWTDNTELEYGDARQVIDGNLSELVNKLYSLNTSEASVILTDLMATSLEKNPENPNILTIMGLLCFNDGNAEKAFDYLHQALALDPENFVVLANIAYIQVHQGEKEKAIETLTHSLDIPSLSEENRQYAIDMIDFIKHGTNSMSDYEFEFRFLPSTAANLSPSAESVEILSAPEQFIAVFLADKGWRLRDDFGDIKADVFGKDAQRCIVWTMPFPPEAPLALYIGFIPDTVLNGYRVYFLEKSFPFDGKDIWVLGHTKANGDHTNFGAIACPPNPESFLKAVRKVQ